MWNGNAPGADPTLLSGSPLDPADPQGYLYGQRVGTGAPATSFIAGNVMIEADVEAVIAGDPPIGTYMLDGYAPEPAP